MSEKQMSVTSVKGGFIFETSSEEGYSREIFATPSKLLKAVKEWVESAQVTEDKPAE